MSDCQDFPRSLRMNVFAIDLAEQIYTSVVGVYGGKDWSWSDLSPETKAIYVQRAANLLHELAPGKRPSPLFDVAAQLAREHAAQVIYQQAFAEAMLNPEAPNERLRTLALENAAQVIGRITPSEPFGIARND